MVTARQKTLVRKVYGKWISPWVMLCCIVISLVGCGVKHVDYFWYHDSTTRLGQNFVLSCPNSQKIIGSSQVNDHSIADQSQTCYGILIYFMSTGSKKPIE